MGKSWGTDEDTTDKDFWKVTFEGLWPKVTIRAKTEFVKEVEIFPKMYCGSL